MLIVGIALHGVCYDFFFVSGQIFIDSKAGKDVKSAAQGLITLATYGVGMLVGFWLAGRVTDIYSINNVHDWRSIWLVPAGVAARPRRGAARDLSARTIAVWIDA